VKSYFKKQLKTAIVLDNNRIRKTGKGETFLEEKSSFDKYRNFKTFLKNKFKEGDKLLFCMIMEPIKDPFAKCILYRMVTCVDRELEEMKKTLVFESKTALHIPIFRRKIKKKNVNIR